MARQTIREFLAEEAADVEAHRDDPPGPMFRSKRPPVDPSQVYSVRIPVAKLEQLRLLAVEAGIDQSELIRRWTLSGLMPRREATRTWSTSKAVISQEASHGSKSQGNNEGTIRQRADGRWEGRVTLADGSQKYYYGKKRADVQKDLLAALKTRQDGLPIMRNEKLTLGEFLKSWLDTAAKGRVRPLTYRYYKQKIEGHILPGLGRVRLADHTAHSRILERASRSRAVSQDGQAPARSDPGCAQ